MTAPLVSIIIPCFRQAQYLREAIDSALAQTYPAVETIVVNDGSDDDTETVALSYGDRIQYVYRANGGLSAARNTGIARAQGKYLKFLDSDDHLHPEQIAWQVAAMEDRTDRVCFTGLRNYQDGMPEKCFDHIPQHEKLLPEIFSDHDGCAPLNMLVSAEMTRRIGCFDQSLRFAEDWEFVFRLALEEPEVVVDPRIGGYYRKRPGTLSGNRPGTATTGARILVKVHDILRQRNRPDWFGPELLQFEHAAYRRLMMLGVDEPELTRGLAERIDELRRRCGKYPVEGRFRNVSRLLGYSRFERLRVRALRAAGRLPSVS